MVLFGRRRTVVHVEVVPDEQEEEKEKETRRRNRLSKPLTNSKISTSASSTSLQEPVTRSQNPSTSELVPAGPLSSHPSNPVLRHQIRSEVFDSDRLSPNDALKSSSTLSLAQMMKQSDKNAAATEDAQEPSVSASKPKKRKSLILRRLSAHNSSNLSRSASKEHVSARKGDIPASSPSSSLDRMVDAPSIPPTRRASFTPGVATRKPSEVEKKQETIEESEERSVVGSEYFDWQPRPPVMAGRVGTPADLSYSHLAGLRIGSLQVMNGRASPAFSEMSKVSKHLLAVPKQHRDISSEYGDADDEVPDAGVAQEESSFQQTQDTINVHRSFSWESKKEETEEDQYYQEDMDVRTKIPLDMDDDQASLMAKEYMAELPASPFPEIQSGSSSGSVRRMRSEGSLQKTPSLASLQRTPSPDVVKARDSSSPVSPLVKTPSSSGSVVRKSNLQLTVKVLEVGDADGQHRDSAMSWYSPIELSFNQDEAFQSALEFPLQKSPTRPQPQPQPSLDKSDSGYSSTNSIRSLRTSKAISPVQRETLQLLPAPTLNAWPQEPELRTMSSGSELRQRPSILKTRKTEPNVPTFANLRPAIIALNSTPAIPSSVETSIKPTKPRKKLQKKRTQSRPAEKIAVTRVRSFEADSVPAIPFDVMENLRVRTKQVPELEQTYNRLSNQASFSTMKLSMAEIRFPSPEPQQAVQVQRSRSLSRPRSWISRSKENASRSRRNSDLSQADALAIINDFGTAASTLGSSPYDLIHEKLATDRPTGASKRSSAASRPKSMMDDKTAAEVARLRRRSLQQRDALAERRASFNDRGGIPGKNLRPASMVSDVPPITQEMLQTVYRTSSMQRQASMTSGPAPPQPPPHSPRPAYVDHHKDHSDLEIAPPPPSHSPRPVDITPDPWAAQAAAWKARRQSLGAALSKQARDPYRSEQAVPYSQEPLYPIIPLRTGPQRMGWPQFTASPEEYFPSRPQRHDEYEPYTQTYQRNYHQPGDRHHHGEETGYDYQYSHQYATDDYQPNRGRPMTSQGSIRCRPLPEPSATQQNYSLHAHSHSQAVSGLGHASYLDEEFHPANLDRLQSTPDFGWYSGGMEYGSERDNGFGGSSRTRSVSGKAIAAKKNVPLRTGYGADFRDLPVLSMVRV